MNIGSASFKANSFGTIIMNNFMYKRKIIKCIQKKSSESLHKFLELIMVEAVRSSIKYTI